MKAKTSIKVGYVGWQHNETLVGCQAKRSFNVKTNIRTGPKIFLSRASVLRRRDGDWRVRLTGPDKVVPATVGSRRQHPPWSSWESASYAPFLTRLRMPIYRHSDLIQQLLSRPDSWQHRLGWNL
jgi:hypothetical protein